MNLQTFIDKYRGKEIDWDGAYDGQCVDLFRQYNHDVLEIDQPNAVVGAADFWANYDTDPNLHNNFSKIANTPDLIPQEGDVAVWNKRMGGGYGHIAVCTGEGDVDYFESFDQNWSKISYCEIVLHTYSSFYGVLRPKGKTMSDTECTKQLEECKSDNQTKSEQMKNLEEQIVGKDQEISDLKIELGEEQDARKGDLQKIATKLACSDDLVEILKEIEKLIVAEEGLVACLDDKRECGENYAEKSLELSKVYENIKLLSGYSIKTPEGVKRSLEAYTAMHSKQAPSEIIDYAFLVRLFGYTIFTKKEE